MFSLYLQRQSSPWRRWFLMPRRIPQRQYPHKDNPSPQIQHFHGSEIPASTVKICRLRSLLKAPRHISCTRFQANATTRRCPSLCPIEHLYHPSSSSSAAPPKSCRTLYMLPWLRPLQESAARDQPGPRWSWWIISNASLNEVEGRNLARNDGRGSFSSSFELPPLTCQCTSWYYLLWVCEWPLY